MTEPLVVERTEVLNARAGLSAAQRAAQRMVAVAQRRLAEAERRLAEAESRLNGSAIQSINVGKIGGTLALPEIAGESIRSESIQSVALPLVDEVVAAWRVSPHSAIWAADARLAQGLEALERGWR